MIAHKFNVTFEETIINNLINSGRSQETFSILNEYCTTIISQEILKYMWMCTLTVTCATTWNMFRTALIVCEFLLIFSATHNCCTN